MRHPIPNPGTELIPDSATSPAAPAVKRPPRRLLASEQATRKWDRVFSFGLLLAVLFHVAVFLSWRVVNVAVSPFSAAGPQANDDQAAAGGAGGMQAVELRVVQEQPEAVAVVPAPVVEVEEVPEPRPQPAEQPSPPAQVATTLPGAGQTGSGAESGTETGPGTADGTGAGAGGTEASGAGSGIVPPRPRGMILPPTDRPRELRGQDVTVWVFVSPQGRVLSDSTRLEPATRDAGYNRRLKRSAAEWVFEPGRQNGRPVGSWYPFQITL